MNALPKGTPQKSPNNPILDAPFKITGSGWYVPLLFSKILAHCRHQCHERCPISFTLWPYVKKMDHTHIVLIPKKKDPKNLADYRPIILGNVVSQVLLKVIANHLKYILPNAIFDSQSAFEPNQLITDNTTVASEILHRMRGKVGHMVVKLDISKTYDWVEWTFLKGIYKAVIYNYVLCWLYSMTKCVVIALILFLVFCGI